MSIIPEKLEIYLGVHADEPQSLLEQLCRQPSVAAQDLGIAAPIDDPFVQKIATVAETFAGKPASITPIVGGTLPLLGGLRRYVGLPGLSAPGNVEYWGSAAHAPNENIRLADLQRAVRYNCYMFQTLGE